MKPHRTRRNGRSWVAHMTPAERCFLSLRLGFPEGRSAQPSESAAARVKNISYHLVRQLKEIGKGNNDQIIRKKTLEDSIIGTC
uniref:Uncharacterized protein n=1 Tax=Oryza meridionalis TaxID=40149 RepID=A0A0E0EY94_9ORYZ